MGSAFITELTLARGVRAVRLENDLLAATVLVDKGADIYELIYKPKGIDVLWKSPWGLRRPGGGHPSALSSAVAWIEAYEGGWQEIFPSGGGPCDYKGVELNFHGEASMLAWDYDIVEEKNAVELRLCVRLARSPLRLERAMRVESGQPVLSLNERISNEGGEAIDYMWGHHPAFGAPFLSAACRIDTNAMSLISDDAYEHPHSPIDAGRTYRWPAGGRGDQKLDLSAVPGPDAQRAMLGYFAEYDDEHAWYGITNADLGFGVGMVWPVAAFPHAWFWQEMHASPGFPWYRCVYVMAIEPGTSYPGQGLVNVMEKTGTHRTLQPGESAAAELRAVFYESAKGVTGIDPRGRVTTAE
ncbi:MAG: hypothetical protein QOF01_2771 [Thermomicrobiales bacterium]|jgi:hypothetical protein|nr:hypothetical protein [Thermomicrobiales bacterium]